MIPLRVYCALAAAMACVAAVRGAASHTFYVSPTGSDGNGSGTRASPWATWVRAAQAVRGVNQGMRGDIDVFFRAGEYFLDATVELGLLDGGLLPYRVRYLGGWEGDNSTAPVVFHSGASVTGWSLYDATRNIWAAPLPSGITDARQAYINGDRINATNVDGGIPGDVVNVTSTGYRTTDDLLWAYAAEQSQGDIELLFTGAGSSWTECRLRVASISPAAGGGADITMAEPGFSLGRNRFDGQNLTLPVSITNVFGALSLTTPGVGYINAATSTLYYVPRPGEDLTAADVRVPALDVLLRVSGDAGAQPAPVRVAGLSFERLTFAYAGWLEPNSGLGYVDMQSGFRVLPQSTPDSRTWVPTPSNVQLHAVADVVVANCSFVHLGAVALQIDGGSVDVIVANSSFADVSGGGVYFGQVDDVNATDERANARIAILDNVFYSIPVEYHDHAAILGGYVINSTIAHNSVLGPSNTGISLGWGWSSEEASNCHGNAITANYVYGGNWLLEDGGSIYVLGPQRRSVMSENYVSSQVKLFGALYTDEGSAYWHITRNVVSDSPEWLHIWTTSIHDELVEKCWTNQNYSVVAGTNITVRDITLVAPGTPFPVAAQAVINASGTSAMFGPKL